jgi:hypothetical protein
MAMTQEQLFEKYFPQLDEFEVSQSVAANGPIVSVNCRAAVPSIFIAKFATEGGGSFPVIVMNRLTAQHLCRALVEQGFGPPAPQTKA